MKNDRLTNILVECPELIASVRVGVLNVLKPLEKLICHVRFCETKNIGKVDLQWCDILVCVRGSELATQQIVLEAKRLERLVIYFLDDDLLHLPKELLAYEYFEYYGHKRALQQCLASSDALWGVNEQIHKSYQYLCGKNRWIKTRVPADIISLGKPKKHNQVVRVLYAGSKDHQKIITDLLRPAIKYVLDTSNLNIEFYCIGPDPHLEEYPQVRHIKYFEDYTEYREFVEKRQFDIALAPTRLGAFFQCKYYNKFVEYTSIGAVGIYTDCPLYNQIIQHAENGFLVENTVIDWANKIVQLAKDRELRAYCQQNAYHLLVAEFNADTVAKNFLNQLPEIKTYRAPKVDINEIHLCSPQIYFYFDRIKFLFCQYNILAIPIIAYKLAKKIIILIKKVFFRYV